MTISNLKVTPAADGKSAQVTWTPSNAASMVEQVIMWRKSGAQLWAAVGLSRAATSYSVQGLAPGSSYDFRVVQDAYDGNKPGVVMPDPTTPATGSGGGSGSPGGTGTPSPTPSPSGSGSTPTPNAPLPGSWKLIFDDEFNGTVVNTSTWDEHNGWANQNNVTDEASNVSEAGGDLILKLVDPKHGAAVAADGFGFARGEYVQARVRFPTQNGRIAQWPAWWVSGPNWPAAGESDIAEGLGGLLTVNYHSPTGAHNQGAVPGNWADGQFHDYGIYRDINGQFCAVYWDGQLVKRYGTDDNGQPEIPILTIGYSGGTFQPVEMDVDNVRAWAPVAG